MMSKSEKEFLENVRLASKLAIAEDIELLKELAKH